MGNNILCLKKRIFIAKNMVRIAAADSINLQWASLPASINIFYNNIAGQDAFIL